MIAEYRLVKSLIKSLGHCRIRPAQAERNGSSRPVPAAAFLEIGKGSSEAIYPDYRLQLSYPALPVV